MNKTLHRNDDRTIGILSVLIIVSAISATAVGIYSEKGPGPYTYTSIRGETITVYGEGIYQHMSEEVALQGIAQDYFTLFAALPLLAVVLRRVQEVPFRTDHPYGSIRLPVHSVSLLPSHGNVLGSISPLCSPDRHNLLRISPVAAVCRCLSSLHEEFPAVSPQVYRDSSSDQCIHNNPPVALRGPASPS